MFKDPDCKKLAPNKLETGTYKTDKVKLVDLYILPGTSRYLMPPRSDLYVASNNGSVLLSCVTILALGLI